MKLHRTILSPQQQSALARLAQPVDARGFYLGGGTALALRLGHRRSIDLDWFSQTKIGSPLVLAERLRRESVPLATTSVAEGTLHGVIAGVQTSFLEYPYARLRALGRAREGFRLASLDDLACMKLGAIVDRGAKKDFVDIYALVKKHRPLHELIALYPKRFQVADVGHVLVALSYFADADATPMPRMLWDVGWEEVRSSLEGWLREAVRRM